MIELEEIIDIIKHSDNINIEDSFSYAQIASKLLRTEQPQDGRRIIINILDNWGKLDSATSDMWIDLIEAAGFYPYLTLNEYDLSDTASKIRKEYHKSELLDEVYFHEEQLLLKNMLDSDKNVVVSAPTSFGKSLLIDELMLSNKYKNIVIIQPTLALLDETRRRLVKYKNNYKLLVRTSQKPDDNKNNIFLFTAERVMEYQEFPKIDLLILDEFYKLSAKRDDERSDVLNNAFYKLLIYHKCKFYLLGPNIDGISPGFAEKYNAIFFKTNYNLVDYETIDIYASEKDNFGLRGKKKIYKENYLFNLLTTELIDEQTLIYCSSPSRVREYSKKLVQHMIEKGLPKKEKNFLLIEWIRENISPEWSLIDCLNYGIGIHDGALPKHITTSIINYFNDKKLNFLFCTTTIIEGVNTSAKNAVFFDQYKGNRIPIDYFDYSNIKGRAGRLMVHYTGKIYNFNKPIQKEDVIVDIPFYHQEPIADEILIQLEKSDVLNPESKQYEDLEGLDEEEKELIKRNGLLVWGQKSILDHLNENMDEVYRKICWSGYPEYTQLRFLIFQCWDNLMKKNESKARMTKNSLLRNVYRYASDRSLMPLIKSQYDYQKERQPEKSDRALWDDAILWAFYFQRHWLHYKIPKWIGVFNSLQKFVCEKKNLDPGEYTYYANQIENDFVQDNLAILLEYGIPLSAITKFESFISKDLLEEDVLDRMRKLSDDTMKILLPYEQEKIKTSL